jgi:hypothetical protein
VYKFIIIWNEAPYNLTFLLNTEDKGSFSLWNVCNDLRQFLHEFRSSLHKI